MAVRETMGDKPCSVAVDLARVQPLNPVFELAGHGNLWLVTVDQKRTIEVGGACGAGEPGGTAHVHMTAIWLRETEKPRWPRLFDALGRVRALCAAPADKK